MSESTVEGSNWPVGRPVGGCVPLKWRVCTLQRARLPPSSDPNCLHISFGELSRTRIFMSQTLSSLFAPRKLPSLVHANEPDHSNDCHGDLLGAIHGALCLVVFVLLIHGASHGSLHSARSSRFGWSTLHIFDLRSGDNCGDRIPNLECESEHSKVFQRGPELSSTLDDCNPMQTLHCRVYDCRAYSCRVYRASGEAMWRRVKS